MYSNNLFADLFISADILIHSMRSSQKATLHYDVLLSSQSFLKNVFCVQDFISFDPFLWLNIQILWYKHQTWMKWVYRFHEKFITLRPDKLVTCDGCRALYDSSVLEIAKPKFILISCARGTYWHPLYMAPVHEATLHCALRFKISDLCVICVMRLFRNQGGLLPICNAVWARLNSAKLERWKMV